MSLEVILKASGFIRSIGIPERKKPQKQKFRTYRSENNLLAWKLDRVKTKSWTAFIAGCRGWCWAAVIQAEREICPYPHSEDATEMSIIFFPDGSILLVCRTTWWYWAPHCPDPSMIMPCPRPPSQLWAIRSTSPWCLVPR